MTIANILHKEQFSDESFNSENFKVDEIPEADLSEGSHEWIERLGLWPEEEDGELIRDLPDALVGTFGSMAKRALEEREPPMAEFEGASKPVPDTTVFPFRAVAFLLIDTADGPYRGTGFFVSPRTVVTAGHNVFLGGSWVKRIRVIPGLQVMPGGRLLLPFGKTDSSQFASVDGWVNGSDPNYDYGAIRLDDPVGNAVGWFGLGVSGTFPGAFSLVGYPDTIGTQVLAWGEIIRPDPLRLYYNIPTATGQSGGPVFPTTQPFAMAIHAYYSGQFNSGVRVTQDVRSRIEGWRT